MQREHEAAIVDLVTHLELATRGATVFTERECRRLEHAGADKFSVEISAIHSEIARRDRTRWPDVVVEVTGGRRAIELEFAPKGGKRPKAIVNAHAFSPRYGETLFMLRNATLRRRILEYVRSAYIIGGGRPKMRVVAWPGLPTGEREALPTAIERRASAADQTSPAMSEQALREALGY